MFLQKVDDAAVFCPWPYPVLLQVKYLRLGTNNVWVLLSSVSGLLEKVVVSVRSHGYEIVAKRYQSMQDSEGCTYKQKHSRQ